MYKPITLHFLNSVLYTLFKINISLEYKSDDIFERLAIKALALVDGGTLYV